MPELEPITREETLLDGGDLTPITRKEMFIKRIYDKTQTIPEPITREEYFLKKAGEGSGGDVTIEQLNVTKNGTYSESGKAYSPVVVNVKTPENAYLLEDAEGLPSDIASFEASNLPMNKLKVGIEPQQDLHGYDHPWVGGAGKNILPMTVEGIKQANTSGTWNNNTYTFHDVTFTIETDEAENVLGIRANGTSGGTAYLIIFDGDLELSEGTKVLSGCIPNGSDSTYYLQFTAMPNSYTDVGDGISFGYAGNIRCAVTIYMTDGTSLSNALFQPMIEYGSSKTTFERYSNICPISGHTEANVTKTGVNVWDEEWEVGGLSEANGAETTNTNFVRSDYMAIKGGSDIYGYSNDARQVVAYLYRYDKSYIGFRVITNASYTTPSDTAFFRIRLNNTKEEVSEFTKGIVSINYPSTDTEYHAYNGATYTIQFRDGDNPLTVYGGTLDVVSGVLTVLRAYVDMGTLNWTKQNTTGNNWRFKSIQSVQNIKLPTDASIKIDNLCSVYQNITANETWTAEKTGITINADGSLLICDLNQANTTALGVVIANQTYCYELATPLTIQLTPTQVKSLLGNNNIWADTGKILEAEYFTKGE